jgi:hypothetical protein
MARDPRGKLGFVGGDQWTLKCGVVSATTTGIIPE